MPLLLNMLSRLVTTFLPRSKRLLLSWLQSPSAVILEPPKIVWHCFHCFSIYFPWSDGTRCHDLSFLNVELKRVWVNSGSWWWTGRPGVLWFMGSQRVGHNWTELILFFGSKSLNSTYIQWSWKRRGQVHVLSRGLSTHITWVFL